MTRILVGRLLMAACMIAVSAGATAPAVAGRPAPAGAGSYWTPERMLATVRAEPTARAEDPVRAETAARAEDPVRAETAAWAEDTVRAEPAAQAVDPVRAETATRAEDTVRAAMATTGRPAASARRALAPGQPAAHGTLESFPQPKGEEWKKGGLVARTTGKLFFKKNGKDNHCSGVVVNTRTNQSPGNLSTVLTAAHCLYSRKSGELSTMVSFVPGYTSSILNSRPYGTFDAIRLMPSPSYISSDGPRYLHDFGFVIVRKNQNGSGQLLQDAVNAALEFSPPGGTVDGGKVWTFGYPSNIKGGVRLVYCSGRARESRDRDLDVIDCDMKEGASGGPLLLDFDPDTGVGKVVSVRAVGDRNADIAGFPRLGIQAAELFESARTVPVP